jgi:hypothetical protein
MRNDVDVDAGNAPASSGPSTRHENGASRRSNGCSAMKRYFWWSHGFGQLTWPGSSGSVRAARSSR